MNDTPLEIRHTMRDLMMKRSGAERMKMAADMFDAARTLVIASLSPGLAHIEVQSRLCERFYGEEVDVDAFSRALHRSRSL